MTGVFTGRAIVFPSVVVVQSIALLRNLAVARIIGPEQFGVAAIFILVSQFLDLTTDTGLNKFLLSHRHGQRANVQASVHYVALVRGALISAAMLLLGYPTLRLMNVTPSFMAIIILAILPIAAGLLHYDNARLQQRGIFLNDAVGQVVGEVAGITVTIIVALTTGSYISVLAGLAARASAQALSSHLLATRHYQLRMSPSVRRELYAYSGPLLINGFILFFSMQSDRALVAVLFAPAILGVYAAAMQLLTAASTVLTKTLGATYLPAIARAHLLDEGFAEVFQSTSRIVRCLFVSMVTSYAALGPWLIPAIYGHRFAIDAMSIALVGTVQGFRLVRVWPSTVALATKRTKNVLVGNVLRLLALPIAGWLVINGYGLDGLLIGYALGEFIALALTVQLLTLTPHLARHSWQQVAVVGLVAGVVLVAVDAGKRYPQLLSAITVALIGIAILSAVQLVNLVRGKS